MKKDKKKLTQKFKRIRDVEVLSLDDVAVLLVQLEPTNHQDLVRVRDALNEIAGDESYPPSIKEIIARAAEEIDAIIQGTVSDPDGVIAEVGKLIEKAMDVSQEPGSENLPVETDPDLVKKFIAESRDLIDSAEAALLSLETDPEDMDSLNTVFHAFHSIKGTSGFFGLTFLSDLAHSTESFLSRIRDHEIRYTGGYADLAFRSIDMLKELIQRVEDGEPISKPDSYDDLMLLLDTPDVFGISEQLNGSAKTIPRLGDILVAQGKADRKELEAAITDKGEDPMSGVLPTTLAPAGAITDKVEEPIGLALVRSRTASLTDVAEALRTQRRMAGRERQVESSVRVRTDRLDRLIEMVGELVVAQSMVVQDETVAHGGHYELLRKVTHTGKIVRELQELSMSMRMVPLKSTFQKMARLARDLARKNGKLVNFIAEGEDTEVDRNMVDVINDPLVHMVRNAIDHGIEPPDIRKQNGKPRAGTLRLSAYHSGGSVVVEIEDDGKGLDRESIIEKAVSKGLIESDKGISVNEVFKLIFRPDFSTAEKVTKVSGRGVGLDVVKKGVDALRGRIEITSEPGTGCTFSLRLPLTLAITDGMLVKVGDQRYIVPTVNIHISLRPTKEMLTTVVGRGEMVMFRGELIPIFRLHRLFNIKGTIEDPTKGLLMVVGDNNQRCALLVDELLSQQQVVTKSLGDGIGTVQGISGGAVLGDGRVGLILDTSGIAALARQIGPGDGRKKKKEVNNE